MFVLGLAHAATMLQAALEMKASVAAHKELPEKEGGLAQRPLHKMTVLWEAKVRGGPGAAATRLCELRKGLCWG